MSSTPPLRVAIAQHPPRTYRPRYQTTFKRWLLARWAGGKDKEVEFTRAKLKMSHLMRSYRSLLRSDALPPWSAWIIVVLLVVNFLRWLGWA